jgi:hypothetical protein
MSRERGASGDHGIELKDRESDHACDSIIARDGTRTLQTGLQDIQGKPCRAMHCRCEWPQRPPMFFY